MKTLALLFLLVAGSSSVHAENSDVWLDEWCFDWHPFSGADKLPCTDDKWADVHWYLQFLKDNWLHNSTYSEIDLRGHHGDLNAGFVSLCRWPDRPANLVLMAKCVRKRWRDYVPFRYPRYEGVPLDQYNSWRTPTRVETIRRLIVGPLND